MTSSADGNSLLELRQVRDQAQDLRDQLSAEYQRILAEQTAAAAQTPLDQRRRQGLETLGKAITAAARAVESIEQALREMEQVRDDFDAQ